MAARTVLAVSARRVKSPPLTGVAATRPAGVAAEVHPTGGAAVVTETGVGGLVRTAETDLEGTSIANTLDTGGAKGMLFQSPK